MDNCATPGISSDLDPIIVTSPSIRSGTTLVQRLLCSSANALIYGEECGKDLELFLQIHAAKTAAYTHSRHKFSSGLKRVLEGGVNDWIIDLMPDIDGYIEALGRACFSGLAYCRDYAARSGRPVWGIKYPGWPPHVLRLIRQALPRSRFIIIHRDIVDCLRSAKAWRAVACEADVRQFCSRWATNLTFMLGMKDDPSVFLLKYDDLVREPGEAMQRLAQFADIRGVNPEVLRHKTNAMGERQSGYIGPADLTDAEQSIAEEAAAAIRKSSPICMR